MQQINNLNSLRSTIAVLRHLVSGVPPPRGERRLGPREGVVGLRLGVGEGVIAPLGLNLSQGSTRIVGLGLVSKTLPPLPREIRGEYFTSTKVCSPDAGPDPCGISNFT